MNRVLAHLIGWASLAIGGALVALVMLVPPWLDLHQSQWERDWVEACARTQAQQVEAYEDFASALNSNDPVLLQRLAHHHLRLKPTRSLLVSLPNQITGDVNLHLLSEEDLIDLDPLPVNPQLDRRAALVEHWLHKPYPIVGIDHPAYEPPDHQMIRLATGPRRLLLLALGGVFLLCGLLMPGLPQPVAEVGNEEGVDSKDGDEDVDVDDDDYVEAEIDDDEELTEEARCG